MKYGYILIGIISFIFTFSIIAASPGIGQIHFNGLKMSEIELDSNFLLNLSNMSYANCIKLDRMVWNNCIKSAQINFEKCNLHFNEESSDEKICDNSFLSEKKSCKNSFENIKDTCAVHRKTILEKLKKII